VLTILFEQAAIALGNARFYRTLEDKAKERTAQLAQANQEINTLNLGFPVGLVEEIPDFVAHLHVDLAPGDDIVLFTDGITAAINLSEELYGVERLCQIVAPLLL
jgi:serine phosphatase RsbU (regulator of sigma subunit)